MPLKNIYTGNLKISFFKKNCLILEILIPALFSRSTHNTQTLLITIIGNIIPMMMIRMAHQNE